MKQQWQALAERFDPLTPRERGMVALASWVVLGMLCYMPIESLILEYGKLTRQNISIEKENKISVELIDLYHQRLAQDVDEEFKQRLTALKEQSDALDAELSFQMVDMVPANYMPILLSELLANVDGIELLGFKSIAPTPLLKVGDEKKTNLYSHGLNIELSGDYFSILTFIEAVENMPNKLYWKKMNYQVAEYPEAKIVLELYTISVNKDFISVSTQG